MFSLTPTQLRARRLRGGLAGYSGARLVGGDRPQGLNSWRHRGATLTVATSEQPMLLEGIDFGVISFAARVLDGADTPVEGCV